MANLTITDLLNSRSKTRGERDKEEFITLEINELGGGTIKFKVPSIEEYKDILESSDYKNSEKKIVYYSAVDPILSDSTLLKNLKVSSSEPWTVVDKIFSNITISAMANTIAKEANKNIEKYSVKKVEDIKN